MRGEQRPVVESFHDGGKTRDKIGAFAGVSGRTVEKIAKVVEAAEREPEKYRKARAGKVSRTEEGRGAFHHGLAPETFRGWRAPLRSVLEPPPFRLAPKHAVLLRAELQAAKVSV